MKVIIAGSRGIKSYDTIEAGMATCPFRDQISRVLCGMCEGPDLLGREWAKIHHIPCDEFKPDWTLGNYMGMVRNHVMGDEADCLAAFWDGESKGTLDMINYMKKLMKPVHIVHCYPNIFDKLTGNQNVPY